MKDQKKKFCAADSFSGKEEAKLKKKFKEWISKRKIYTHVNLFLLSEIKLTILSVLAEENTVTLSLSEFPSIQLCPNTDEISFDLVSTYFHQYVAHTFCILSVFLNTVSNADSVNATLK